MPRRSSIGAAADRAFGFTGGLAKPSNTVAPAITGTTIAGNTLTCSTGTWTGNPTGYSYQWQRNNTTNVGTNSNTYALTTADVGFTINCIVTATNPAGSVSANSNNTDSITSAPVNTVAPAVTGLAVQGQTLTCSTGTWSYSPTSYSYQWKRGGSTNIGTNANAYTIAAGDVGSTISCVVTATNASGSANATSNSTGTVVSNTYTITYLNVAGGGGGGYYYNGQNTGGGGAGGYVYSSFTATVGSVYTATVGGGGGGASGGGYSYLTGAGTAVGGGNGGSSGQNGGGGGSGGGGAGYNDQGQLCAGGAGTSGQGNAGGYGWAVAGGGSGGGGGGATAAGQWGYQSGETRGGGSGGAGVANSITGSTVYYCGGGGGTGWDAWGGGGVGGGAGGGGSGAANTGGGGGGYGGNGGSGVIILSVATSRYSGTKTGNPTITTSGSNTIIKFTSSGTYTA